MIFDMMESVLFDGIFSYPCWSYADRPSNPTSEVIVITGSNSGGGQTIGGTLQGPET